MAAIQDTGVVITGTILATGLTSINQLIEGKLSMRPILGGFVVGTFLLMIALFNTGIAVALALLIMVTSILINGLPIMQYVLKAAS